MADYRSGYLYSLSPIHCGSSGDMGNVLEIAREVHTNFPFIPGSSLRGSVRNEVTNYPVADAKSVADRLFGKELDEAQGTMGVHQIWFSDARLLWLPMKTMSLKNGSNNVFAWISCPTLLRSLAKEPIEIESAVGTRPGTYLVADAEVVVKPFNDNQREIATKSIASFPADLRAIGDSWQRNLIILPDDDFSILLEHALWTQIRNKISDEGGAEVFWTDVCIPRDTIFFYHWGYTPARTNSLTETDWQILTSILKGLFQVGGQANVGRGWVHSWLNNDHFPQPIKGANHEYTQSSTTT